MKVQSLSELVTESLQKLVGLKSEVFIINRGKQPFIVADEFSIRDNETGSVVKASFEIESIFYKHYLKYINIIIKEPINFTIDQKTWEIKQFDLSIGELQLLNFE